MLYGVDIHEWVFPKYAKISVKINKNGSFSLMMSPSFTPGKMPPGVKPGQIPKGMKLFDYDKTIVVSLTYSDCISLIEYAKSKSPINEVNIYRNNDRFNKKVTFTWFPDETDPSIAKFATVFAQQKSGDIEVKFNIPLSFDNLDEFATLLKSYINNYTIIKLFCGVEEQKEG